MQIFRLASTKEEAYKEIAGVLERILKCLREIEFIS